MFYWRIFPHRSVVEYVVCVSLSVVFVTYLTYYQNMGDFIQPTINWAEPTVLIITGASRGLGRTIAIEFSRKLCEGSLTLLMARDKMKLLDTQNAIHNVSLAKAVTIPIDLSLPDSPSYEHLLTKHVELLVGNSGCNSFQQVVLVHNAGTLGDVSKTAARTTSADEVREYMDLNVCSAIFLTSAFLKVFQASRKKVVVNISSLAALQPFEGWSLYCTGKAARDMYFRVLAEEERDSVIVLNYAPGPLVTDMLTQILEQSLPDIRRQFLDARSKNQLLTCEYSVARLISILDKRKFRSGDHVDVYDNI